jgi:hypothetical protein
LKRQSIKEKLRSLLRRVLVESEEERTERGQAFMRYIESAEFYSMMQAYRHSPMGDQRQVSIIYQRLQVAITNKFWEVYGRGP